MYYDKIRHRYSQVLAATGLTPAEFDALLITFKYHWDEYYSHFTLEGKVRQRISYNRKTSVLPLIQDKMFFILVYLKTNPLQELRKHSDKCTFYTLRFDCSFAAANTIKPQLL